METIALSLCAMFVSTTNFLFVLGSECADSGERHVGVNVFVPTNCSPTKCAATGFSEITAGGFNCSIRNYPRNSPNACKEIKDAHAALHHQNKAGKKVQLEEVCQAKLESINLYMFHCEVLPKPEASLNITFQLPLCGKHIPGSSAGAVMVDFNARRNTDFFATHPICRVFDFSHGDFNNLKIHDSILVSYECLAIGLQDTLPQAYYYLAFTAHPTAVLVNYTLLYKHVGQDSMQLAGAAWLSTTQIHVVFQPISGITDYTVTAECYRHQNISQQVSSLQSAELIIPQECNNVSVTVMPLPSQCENKRLTCTLIRMTLQDKRQFLLPIEWKKAESTKLLPVVLSVIGILVILALVIAGFLWNKNAHNRKQADHFVPTSPLEDHKVLCIASPSAGAQKLKMDLKAGKFGVTDAVQEDIQTVGKLCDYSTILIFMHSSLPDSECFKTIMNLLILIFENQEQLLKSVKVVSFCEAGHSYAKPSQVLHGRFSNNFETVFLEKLDQKTYNLPESQECLFKDLRLVDENKPVGAQEQQEEMEHLLRESRV